MRNGATTRRRGRLIATALLVTFGVGAGTAAFGQTRYGIPVERDLHRDIERRSEVTGSIRHAPQHVQSDPTGVAGFSGPPGIYGDSVGSYGPLPPGAPGNEGW
jgi:hypothetical protein